MAIDIQARILAAKANSTATEIVDSFTTGFTFRGAVDYADDLPDSGNSNGDMYIVKYAGSSGTVPLNARYAWGDDGGTDAWIALTTVPYVMEFNATDDWTQVDTSTSGITVAASTHLRGANATAIVWRNDSGTYTRITGTPSNGYVLTQNGDGDITLRVDTASRFAGKIVIA